MTRLAVGIVGCGGRARGHMQALQQFDDVAMVAVCDPDHAAELLSGLPDALDVGQIVQSSGTSRTTFRAA